MQSSKKWVGQGLLCSILFSLGQVAWTATVDGPSVQVSKTGLVEVILERPVSLRTVLDDLCRAADTECEGTQFASDSMVAPLKMSGGWAQVIEMLLDGTGLNYIAVPPRPGQKGSLWIKVASRPVSGDQACPDTQPFEPHVGASGRPSTSDNQDCRVIQSDGRETTPVSVPTVELSPDAQGFEGMQGSGSQATETQVAARPSGSPFPEAGAGNATGTESQTSGSPFPEAGAAPAAETRKQGAGSPFPELLVPK